MRKSVFGLLLGLSASLMAFSFVPVMAEEKAEKKEETFVEAAALGVKSIGDYDLLLKNDTGKEVEKVELSVDQGKLHSNLLLDGDVFAPGEERHLYVTPEIAKEKGKGPVYDLKLTFADGKTSTLHTLPLGDTSEAILSLEDGVAYLTYESKKEEKEVVTLEEENAQAKESEASQGSVSYANTDASSSYTESYEDSGYGNATYGEATYGEATYGEATYGEATYGEATYGEANYGGSSEEEEDSGIGYGYSDEEDDHCLDDGTMLN